MLAFIAATVLCALPSVAGAQAPAAAGLVRDAATKAPLECLHVSLVDAADRAVAHTVTGETLAFDSAVPF